MQSIYYPPEPWPLSLVLSIYGIRAQQLREVEGHVQGHTAIERPSYNFNPDSLIPKPVLLSHPVMTFSCHWLEFWVGGWEVSSMHSVKKQLPACFRPGPGGSPGVVTPRPALEELPHLGRSAAASKQVHTLTAWGRCVRQAHALHWGSHDIAGPGEHEWAWENHGEFRREAQGPTMS